MFLVSSLARTLRSADDMAGRCVNWGCDALVAVCKCNATRASRPEEIFRLRPDTRGGVEVGVGVPTDADRRWGHRRPLIGRALLLFCVLPSAFCLLRAAEPAPGSPAKNWVLPLFTDKEGFRSMTLRGSEARAVGSDRVEVVNLSITVFSGDATAHVDTMLLSPQASFFQADKQARGGQSVRVIRDDLEAVGTKWIYDHGQKRVSLDGGVRIVFQTELKDLLK